MSDTLIEVKNLKVHFFTDEGVVKAVDGVDLTIHRGRTLCLVGESGCGKSVTSRAILQIVHKAGRIVDGQILLGARPTGEIHVFSRDGTLQRTLSSRYDVGALGGGRLRGMAQRGDAHGSCRGGRGCHRD